MIFIRIFVSTSLGQWQWIFFPYFSINLRTYSRHLTTILNLYKIY